MYVGTPWGMRRLHRATSPVIGVALMIALTAIMASVLAAGFVSMGFGLDTGMFDNTTDEQTESDGDLNPMSGSSGDLVRVSDKSAGATNVRYRINFTIQSGSDTVGDSLSSVELEVTDGTPDMFSDTSKENLETVLIDEGSDGTTDREITSDVDGWDVQNDGSKLEVSFSESNYSASANDSVVLIFDGVTNPKSPGTYDIRAQTTGDGNWHTGTIEIIEDGSSIREPHMRIGYQSQRAGTSTESTRISAVGIPGIGPERRLHPRATVRPTPAWYRPESPADE